MNFSPSEFLLFFFLVILSSNNNLLAGVQMPSRDTVVSQRKSSNDTKMIKGLENSKIQLDYRSSKPNNVHERPNLTIKTFHTNNQNSQRQTRTTKEIETKRINNGNTISKTQDKSNLEAANLETQNKLFEKKYFKILDELSRISKKLGEVEKRKELESKLQEYNQLEKIINQKQQRWLNLSTPTALKTDLTESFQEKMANWLGKAIVLKFQLQDITNQDESQDENRFWTFSNIKNKFKNELRKRNEKNLEKKVSSLIQSSQ